MSATLTKNGRAASMADLLGALGDIPADRVLIDPPPGRATEADVIRLAERDGRLYELVDGTLVEKAMGVGETKLEGWILHLFYDYLEDHPIGEVTPGTGPLRLAAGVVRMPDVGFFLWKHATTEEEDREHPIANTFPDLAVEVISPSNTPKEMARKRREYFKAGTSLVWQVYPARKEVEVYTSPNRVRTLTIDDTLDGGALLPGFRLPLRTLFGRPTKGTRRRKK